MQTAMFTLNCKGKIKAFNGPQVMGILNLTPDSFYEGYLTESIDNLLLRAAQQIHDGAAILDLGGQSTRPGSERLNAEDELKRVMPALTAIRQAFPDILLSIDTYQASVAAACVAAGADLVNDISFGEMDQQMIPTVARLNVPYIGMHMKGRPENMQTLAQYESVTTEVLDYLIQRSQYCAQAGIRDIIVDPGFGFGKTIEHNFSLLHNLHAFQVTGKPVMVGLSRKSTIYRTLGITPAEALNGTTVLHTIALEKGAQLLRVHDVKEAVEVIRLMEAYKKMAPEEPFQS
jgi:dihydropteroate synthase